MQVILTFLLYTFDISQFSIMYVFKNKIVRVEGTSVGVSPESWARGPTPGFQLVKSGHLPLSPKKSKQNNGD
jgi:hypothetical protein